MAAPGETDLTTLLASMAPRLHDETYVFLSFPPTAHIPADIPIQMQFAEPEGTTVITTLAAAQRHGLDRSNQVECALTSRMVTLMVQSSLDAVGFMARISRALAAGGVPCNCVAAFWHDHLFVPVDKCEEAMRVLERVRDEARGLLAGG